MRIPSKEQVDAIQAKYSDFILNKVKPLVPVRGFNTRKGYFVAACEEELGHTAFTITDECGGQFQCILL